MGVKSAGATKQELRPKRLRKQRAGGDGNEFPLRVAKVTRVDAKRMVVALYTLTGGGDSFDNVALTFPNAGARHFMGAIPEINDLCVIGYASAESGSSRTPYIVGWIVPGPLAGYDWMISSPTSPEELDLTPALRETLQGTFGRRRHKLRQMEAGNIFVSSSQGSDLFLDESVLLANRRGNEILLRDQDQAIVFRSLQQFHAGAGFRVYGGMVQRDATLLPAQMFGDDVNWAADKQLDSEGKPLSSSLLTASGEDGAFTPNPVYDANLSMGYTDPSDTLRRGLFIDELGGIFDQRVVPDAVYGGKPIYRVSVDSSNGVLDDGSDVFTEYRIEVAHTSDGSLPVTEQTDGVDIDRLLPNAPTTGVDGSGDPNPLNRSPNAPMVEFILGTAIGNDPIGARESYGIPLVPSLFAADGSLSPGIRAAGPNTPVSEHAAFLVRVKNPTDPKAKDAFLAITKGGAFRSYFPGAGSKSHQEFYQTGRQTSLGMDADGQSQRMEADGTISLRNTGKGRQADNIGLEFRSENGAVEIFAGGATTAGAGTPSSNPELTPAGSEVALFLRSKKSALFESLGKTKIAGQEIELSDADSIRHTANTAIAMNSGDTLSMSSKVLGVTVAGKAEYSYGGPKDSSPTNGPSRTQSFNGTALTGATGGTMDQYEMVYGGRSEKFRVGRHETTLTTGSYNIQTMGPNVPSMGPGSGVSLVTGLPFLSNKAVLGVGSANLISNIGTAKVQATKGSATLQGTTGASVKSTISVKLKAPFVRVAPGFTPFIGGVLTDGCLNPVSGRTFKLSGSFGVSTFRVTL